jgi:hypothetical protein
LNLLEQREVELASMIGARRREYSEARWPAEPSDEEPLASDDAPFRPTDLDRFSRTNPSLGKQAARRFVRFVIILCTGVAATLAWQSYGDWTREALADSYPQLGWLAPQATALAVTDSEVAPTAPTTPSADGQPLEAMSLGLTAVRQSVDELTAQLVAGQQKLAGDVARLQAAQQEILDKMPAPLPRPAAAAPRKPVPLMPPPSPPPVPR